MSSERDTIEKISKGIRLKIEIDPALLDDDDCADICNAFGEGISAALKRLGLLLSEEEKQ